MNKIRGINDNTKRTSNTGDQFCVHQTLKESINFKFIFYNWQFKKLLWTEICCIRIYGMVNGYHHRLTGYPVPLPPHSPARQRNTPLNIMTRRIRRRVRRRRQRREPRGHRQRWSVACAQTGILLTWIRVHHTSVDRRFSVRAAGHQEVARSYVVLSIPRRSEQNRRNNERLTYDDNRW